MGILKAIYCTLCGQSLALSKQPGKSGDSVAFCPYCKKKMVCIQKEDGSVVIFDEDALSEIEKKTKSKHKDSAVG